MKGFGGVDGELRIDKILRNKAWKCPGTLGTSEYFLWRLLFPSVLMFQKSKEEHLLANSSCACSLAGVSGGPGRIWCFQLP